MNIILNGKEITFITDQYNDLVDHGVKEQKRKNWNLHWQPERTIRYGKRL